MMFKELNSTENELHLLFENTTEEFMNILRRAASYNIDTFAIEDVYFKSNNSVMYDELIAHRLGLLVIKADPAIKSLDDPKIEFKLEKTGPHTVRAKDIEIVGEGVEFVNPHAPIIMLSKNQNLEFTAVAKIGNGKEHMKWSPGNIYYFHYPKNAKGNESLDELRKMIDSQKIDKFKKDLDNFIFVIESWGQMTPKEVLSEALAKVQASLDAYKL
jgi:DNA-directed RNA polymerase subunit D